MAKLKMKRIEIVTLSTEGKAVFDLLQKRGVVQVTKYDELENFDTQKSVSQFEKHSTLADEALTILNKFAPAKKGLLDSFCDLKEIDANKYEQMSGNIDIYMRCDKMYI